ncbi:MAG TPA: acyl-CoA dehydrogenase [Trebonia sp.]
METDHGIADGLAISEEHRQLAQSARAVLADRDARGAARAALEAAPGIPQPPAFWKDVVSLGWLGLHIPETRGGQGSGLPELAVVVEELGRAAAPGPFVPTALAAAVVAECGDAADRSRLLPELLGGAVPAAIGLPDDLRWRREDRNAAREARDRLDGTSLVPVGAGAGLILLPVGPDLAVLRPGADLTIEPVTGIDPARASARVTCAGAVPDAILRGGARKAVVLGRVLTAAEAAGGARACTEAAVAYAKERVQFGSPIGSFQAVKHMCADMLIQAELATAAAWDAARAGTDGDGARLAVAAAATVAVDAFVRCAELSIQIHGGTGFTWAHDAHLFLRRAYFLRGTARGSSYDAGRLSLDGVKHDPLPAPPEDRPELGIGTWVVPALLSQATPEQAERWGPPSLAGELRWCQLFSEPGAGSDAASVTTRAVRVDGGWRVTGRKVWTSDAQVSDRGLATVRTDPDASRHEGITMLVIDMTSPGVTVRPLREITGEASFNEVFLDDVFVPDADVVGKVNAGWTVARSTLAGERVSIGSGEAEFCPVSLAVDALRAAGPRADSGLLRDLGGLVSEDRAMRLLGVRDAARAAAGAGPGPDPEGTLAKLLSGEHQQRVADLLARIGGTEFALAGDPAVQRVMLFTRGLTIAGGTSEIIRTQIAERVLGLPRS